MGLRQGFRPGKWWSGTALEGAVVTLLLTVAGFFYLRPASTELLRGNASVMVGEGGDSITIPWQYRLVVDAFHAHPLDTLFRGGIYSDQMNAPEGAVHLVPVIERLFVLLYAPFMDTDLMLTAVVWGFMVLSGLCLHAYGRMLGWPRAVAFALGFAWAFCPFTRSRAVVHPGFVATYWVPLLFLALHVLARPPERMSSRRATVAAAGGMLFAVFAVHYYVVIAAVMAPVFILYYFLVLPRGASRVRATGRLVLAAAPATLFLVGCLVQPAPASAMRALANVVETRSETNNYLSYYGAHPLDYVLGDMKFGHRDLIPLREKLTREARTEIGVNRHERTNGIRWTVLACCLALAVALSVRRFRRRLSRDERILGGFAFVLAFVAFALALSPQGLRVYDVDLGPVQLIARVLPKFRVPNRTGILVHFAALLGAGLLVARVLRRRLATRGLQAPLLGAALAILMVLDYPPRYDVTLAPVEPRNRELEASAGGGACGAGLMLPYATWDFKGGDYYRAYTSLRGTSCKLLHTTYLTTEDDAVRRALGKETYTDKDRWAAERLARCAGASWVLFVDAPEDLRRSFCAEMGWTLVSSTVCRAPRVGAGPPIRSLRECSEDL